MTTSGCWLRVTRRCGATRGRDSAPPCLQNRRYRVPSAANSGTTKYGTTALEGSASPRWRAARSRIGSAAVARCCGIGRSLAARRKPNRRRVIGREGQALLVLRGDSVGLRGDSGHRLTDSQNGERRGLPVLSGSFHTFHMCIPFKGGTRNLLPPRNIVSNKADRRNAAILAFRGLTAADTLYKSISAKRKTRLVPHFRDARRGHVLHRFHAFFAWAFTILRIQY